MTTENTGNLTNGDVLTFQALRDGLRRAGDRIDAARADLCALDAIAGDGDLGVTLATGFEAIRPLIESPPAEDAGQLLSQVGMQFGRAAPSTMGTLSATAFLRAGTKVRGKTNLTAVDVADMLEAAAGGIRDRGKADVGQRTVLDALVPAAEAARAAAEGGESAPAALRAAADAAERGAEATATMEPTWGRAAWIKDRARGNKDAGAAAWATILQGLAGA
ncbi:MAG: DAK2 domain-containing protein [Chloroflexi bacterium]|nr:DAK2 domain-containing protein [Chloroflexota bacterium]